MLQTGVGVGLVERLGVVDETGRSLHRGTGHHDAHAQSEQVEDGAHPARVAPGQVVVDGDQVCPAAAERVQVERQAGDQRLALAGFHLGDLAQVEDDAPDHLHVEGAQPERALGGLAHEGVGVDQQVFQFLARAGALSQLVGVGAESGVVEGFELGLQLGDRLRGVEMLADLALVGVKQWAQDLQCWHVVWRA